MKAKEYFEKYGSDIYAECMAIGDPTKIGPVMQRFLMEFSAETQTIYRNRHAQRVGALKAVVLDQNEKWNAMCRLYQAKYGNSPLKENGWRELVKLRAPELFKH